MTLYTTAEFELSGAGGGETVEVQIAYDIEPGTRGSWDEPPCGDEAINVEVTHWRLYGVSNWTKAADPFKCILEGCIDNAWLLEQAEDWDAYHEAAE